MLDLSPEELSYEDDISSLTGVVAAAPPGGGSTAIEGGASASTLTTKGMNNLIG